MKHIRIAILLLAGLAAPVEARAGDECPFPCVNGECIATVFCECRFGWAGAFCDLPVCAPACGNGVCEPGPCVSTMTDSGQMLDASDSQAVALGDLDGDGDLDAFVANTGSQPDRVWLNDNGVFSDSGQVLGDSISRDIALGDLDGDNDLDAFVAVDGNGPNRVWLNKNGVFTVSPDALGASSSIGVALGDLDGDGDLDAFVANNGVGNRVWLNNNGRFFDSGQSLGARNSFAVALGDLDGDGDLDAFVANNGETNAVWFNSNGVFADSGVALGGVASLSADVALGDLDGDGDLDALVANNGATNALWLNSNGVFTDSAQDPGAGFSGGVALADLDADGDLDAFIANTGANVVLLNDNGVLVNGGPGLGDQFSRDVALGDLDGDGTIDAFVVNALTQDNANRVWLNDLACHSCDCAGSGFAGEYCDVDIDECLTDPCANGGTCTNTPGSFSCDCSGTGFGGTLCDVDVDECLSDPCQNGGSCVNTPGGFECDCTGTGYTGAMCDTDVDECLSGPCLNGGACLNTDGGFSCDCRGTGFTGPLCNTDINECLGAPCQNGAPCSNTPGGFDCDCTGTGYTGQFCHEDIDECLEDPCANGGACENVLGSFICDCTGTGYTGPTCGNDVNECLDLPCQNGGSCFNFPGTFICTCAGTGYTGPTCSIDIDECAMGICLNGSACTNLPGGYSCDCGTTGYEGETCSVDIDECLFNPCLNGGTCANLDGGFNCDCSGTGFEGPRCEFDASVCDPDPCLNGGACSAQFEGFACDCTGTGYVGELCETDVNECLDSPCQNGGGCINFQGNFICVCSGTGYTGPLCTTDVDECEFGFCHNGSICTNLPGSFECDCSSTGYEGANCLTDIDECADLPCDANAQCANLPGDYRCTCDPGYLGDGFTCRLPCDPAECPVGTFPLTDTEGDFGGWCAGVDPEAQTQLIIGDVDVPAGTAVLQVVRTFESPLNGDAPLDTDTVRFVQICDDASSFAEIRIDAESILNDTGYSWSRYQWRLEGNDGAVWLDVASSSAFDTSPFMAQNFAAFIDWPVSQRARQLDVHAGELPSGHLFVPGLAAGDLVIRADLRQASPIDFLLVQQPSCGPGICATDAVLLEEDFAADTGQFFYQDDTFRNTASPARADGWFTPNGGRAGGAVQVELGPFGTGQSGGWAADFEVCGSPQSVDVELAYRLIFDSSYEPAELGDALLSVDGNLVGIEPVDYLARFQGAFTFSSSNEGSDAEEDADGVVTLVDDRIALGRHAWVGLRFAGVDVPPGATIGSAIVLFHASNVDNVATALRISGEDAGDPEPFTPFGGDLSSRARTDAHVDWNSVPGWTSGNVFQSPELASVAQEIVDAPGWSAGNAMVILFESLDLDGRRRALAHAAGVLDGPQLLIAYTSEDSDPQDSGWLTQTFSLPLADGPHEIIVGGFNNASDQFSERTSVFFDDIRIVARYPGAGTGCDDGLFCNGMENCIGDFCVSEGNPCAAGDACDEFNDTCVSPGDGDFDGDGDVDLADYHALQLCFGRSAFVFPACQPGLLVGDEYIEAADVAAFTQAITGP